MTKRFTFDKVIRIAITALLLWAIIWLLGYLSDVLIPFAISLLLAYFINPLVNLIQKKIKKRAICVFLSLFIVLIIITIIGYIVIPMIVNEFKQIGPIFSDLVSNSELAEKASKRLPPDILNAFKELLKRKDIQEFFKTDSFLNFASTSAKKILPGIWKFIAGTTNLLFSIIGLLIIGLYLIFLLLDFQKFHETCKELIPPIYKNDILSFIKEVDISMNKYFRAKAFVSIIVAIIFTIGFSIIGLPMAILLGISIGILNMIPYLQIIGMIPAIILSVILALKTGNSIIITIIYTLLVFIISQVIEETILTPKIMGDATGLSPVMILLSLSIWGKLLGLFGLLIAIPITCIILAYYKRLIIETKKIK